MSENKDLQIDNFKNLVTKCAKATNEIKLYRVLKIKHKKTFFGKVKRKNLRSDAKVHLQ